MDPHTFVTTVLNTDSKKDDDKKTLVMLGDSITHQTLSGNFCRIIQKRRASDLWVVNCGQNSILTYTILKERVDWVVACNPHYVSVMIGTNDIKGVYCKEWGDGSKVTWNIDENVSFENFEKNLKAIIEKLVAETEAVVGVNTLVMMGEDLERDANVHIRKANVIIKKLAKAAGPRVTVIDSYGNLEKYLLKNSTEEKRRASLKVEDFGTVTSSLAIKMKLLGQSYNQVAKPYGLTVMVDALHLNDTGAEVVAEGVLGWLNDNHDSDFVKIEHSSQN